MILKGQTPSLDLNLDLDISNSKNNLWLFLIECKWGGMASPTNNLFEIIIIAILVIAILVLTTFIMWYSRLKATCQGNPSPWCYSDWMCPNLPQDEQNSWDKLKTAKLAAVPRSEGACTVMNGTQSNCPNSWPFLPPGS